MPRFTEMLVTGMRARGHEVELWAPEAKAWHLAPCASLRKWFGYIDQFILFPRWAKRRIAEVPPETLFVFIDQALGPWVPLVADRPHIIHCHDFLAQRSARGDFPEHRTSWTGRLYQRYIRRGYRQGKAFIAISKATQNDLHAFLGFVPAVSEVIYNGYNADFRKVDRKEARKTLPEDLRQ
ncbi:MAG: glycosyltransferase family 4 protein, partial [Opitutales bacterium]